MNLVSLARRHPRWLDAAICLDRAPAAGWLALQAAALLPTWVWMARRFADGSDDPLGLLALAALAVLVGALRRRLRAAPRLGWLALAALGTLAATALRGGLGIWPAWPPLVVALVAVLALACGLLAFLPLPGPRAVRGAATLPVLGLAVLALPLLSSLQFYAGYPLRVLTAEGSRWLLAPWFQVARAGSTLQVDGRLVIVDAPCSGVQMAWLGYFTACVMALWTGRDSRGFAARLPVVGALVLAGNVLRNALLVGFEGAGRPLPGWAHQALGLVLLALVCGGIAAAMAASAPVRRGGWFARRTGRPLAPCSPPAPAVRGLITTAGGRRVDTAR